MSIDDILKDTLELLHEKMILLKIRGDKISEEDEGEIRYNLIQQRTCREDIFKIKLLLKDIREGKIILTDEDRVFNN